MKKTLKTKTLDETLVLNFQNGDEHAFDQLVNKYQSLVVNGCYHFLGNRADAEDAAQDVFVKVYSALHYFSPNAQFTTWLHRIVINHCLNIKRSKGRRWNIAQIFSGKLPEKLEPIDPETPLNKIEKEEKIKAVHNALNKLKENQRVAIVLHTFQGLSYKEIADVQKCSLSAVETRIHRGKIKLAEILKKSGGF